MKDGLKRVAMPIAGVALPDGETVPALGRGARKMGEQRGRRAKEVRALRLGFDLGTTPIDTAERLAGARRAAARDGCRWCRISLRGLYPA